MILARQSILNMNIIFQDTWNDLSDEELKQYIRDNTNVNIKILSRGDIINTTLTKTISVIFANTDVINEFFRQRGLHLSSLYPTYPTQLQNLYRRVIKKVPFDLSHPIPYFAKPLENSNRIFKGFCVRTQNDVYYVKECLDKYINDSPVSTTFSDQNLFERIEKSNIYISDCVDFISEYRIFYQLGLARGIVRVEFSDDKDGINQSPDNIPSDFLEQCYIGLDALLKISNINFVVLDVGQLKNGEWAVVEVNSPFSLCAYDWPCDLFLSYCSDAFHDLMK